MEYERGYDDALFDLMQWAQDHIEDAKAFADLSEYVYLNSFVSEDGYDYEEDD